MGTNSSKKILRRVNGYNAEEYALRTSAGASDADRIPALNSSGYLDPSLLNSASTSAGASSASKNVILNSSGLIDITMLPYSTTAAASKLVMTNASGVIDPGFISAASTTSGGEMITNGDFSNGTTGWNASSGSTISVVNGALQMSSTAVSNELVNRAFTVTAGFQYKLEWDLLSCNTSTTWYIQNPSYNAGLNPAFTQVLGRKVHYFVATNTGTLTLTFVGGTGSSSATIDNVSLMPISSPFTSTIVKTNTSGYIDPLMINAVPSSKGSADGGKIVQLTPSGLIDPSMLPFTVSASANKIVLTNSSGYINLDLLNATNTSTGAPYAGKIPQLGANGYLDSSLLNSVSSSSGASSAGQIPKLDSNGLLNNSFIPRAWTGGNPSNVGLFPILDATGKIDLSMIYKTTTAAASMLAMTNSSGYLDPSLLNSVNSSAGASSAGKTVILNASGLIDTTMLPTLSASLLGTDSVTPYKLAPTDFTNLCLSSSGDSSEGWINGDNSGQCQSLSVGTLFTAANIASSKAILFTVRDSFYDKYIRIKVGDTFHFQMDTAPLGGVASSYDFSIGLFFYDINKAQAGLALACTRSTGTSGVTTISGTLTNTNSAYSYARIWVQISAPWGTTPGNGISHYATNIRVRRTVGNELLNVVTTTSGAGSAGKIPALNASGVLDIGFLNPTSMSSGAGSAYRLPNLNASGLIDYTMLPYATTAAANKLATTNGSGYLDPSLLNVASTSAGAGSANKIPQLGAAGKLDNSLLNGNTVGGTVGQIPITSAGGLISTTFLNANSTSLGAGSSGKIVLLNASGLVDNSMLPYTTTASASKLVMTNASGWIDTTLLNAVSSSQSSTNLSYTFDSSTQGWGGFVGYETLSQSSGQLIITKNSSIDTMWGGSITLPSNLPLGTTVVVTITTAYASAQIGLLNSSSSWSSNVISNIATNVPVTVTLVATGTSVKLAILSNNSPINTTIAVDSVQITVFPSGTTNVSGKILALNSNGLVDKTVLPVTKTGGTSRQANQIPLLNDSGLIDVSMMPTGFNKFTISATAPTSPLVGDRWMKTDGSRYEWDGANWIAYAQVLSHFTISATAPAGPASGDRYMTPSGQRFEYDGNGTWWEYGQTGRIHISASSSATKTVTAQQFTVIPIDTVNTTIGTSTFASNAWTVPVTGLYFISAGFRTADNTPVGTQVWLTVNTGAVDDVNAVWDTVTAMRKTVLYTRTRILTAGQVLSAYTYSDQGFTMSAGAFMEITLLKQTA